MSKPRSNGAVLAGFLSGIMEAVILILVCLSPWAYGARFPQFEAALYFGVCLVMLLWAAKILILGRVAWRWCPIVVCLALLFLLGIWQITPLSRATLLRISPSTAQLYEKLIPRRPEVLPLGATVAQVHPPAGTTISFYPGGTQETLIAILAVLLLYAVVRNDLASPAFLQRLCIAVLLNGSLLSLFGIIQFFTSERHVLYWTYPSRGSVFGPFANRNHFAFYMNLCIGLSIGLLLSRKVEGARPAFDSGISSSVFERGRRWLLDLPAQILQDAPSLWICLGLVIMISANILCVSRGGFLAMIGAAVVCFLLRPSSRQNSARAMAIIMVAALSAGLLGWLGFDILESRLSSLWKGDTLDVGRLDVGRMEVWQEDALLVRDFPVWGTGLGSHLFAEHLHRRSPPTAWLNAHALNEYLELLVEAGFVGLIIGMVAVICILFYTDRAAQQNRNNWLGGLLLGGLFSYITLLIHSLVEFGLHMPAITFLATTLVALLVGIARPTGHSAASPRRGEADLRAGSPPPTPIEATWRRLRTVPVVVAILLSAGVLYSAGSKICAVDRFHRAALRLRPANEAAAREKQVALLAAASRLVPLDSNLHVEIATTYGHHYDFQSRNLYRQDNVLAACRTVAQATGTANALGIACNLGVRISPPEVSVKDEQLKRDYLLPALRHYVQARNTCLLNSAAHLGIARYAGEFQSADSVSAYLARGKLLDPANYDFWYLCGLYELAGGDLANARTSWKRCLELSDRYAGPILDNLENVLTPTEIATSILPARPSLALAAAKRLFPNPGDKQQRDLLFQRALATLSERSATLTLTELHEKALLHSLVENGAEAQSAYEELRIQAPQRLDWQLEFAQLLYEQGELEKARRQLYICLSLQPDYLQARQLLTVVERELSLSQ